MAAPFSPPTDFTTAELVIGILVSVLSALLIWVDAPRVGRSRWWALAGLLFGGFGLLGWWIVRAFFSKPVSGPHGAAGPGGARAAAMGAEGGAEAGAKCAECGTVSTTRYGFCTKCGAELRREGGDR